SRARRRPRTGSGAPSATPGSSSRIGSRRPGATWTWREARSTSRARTAAARRRSSSTVAVASRRSSTTRPCSTSPSSSTPSGRLLDAAAGELAQALEELRELARGIHPAVLTDRGLAPALTALARRVPLPVDVSCPGGERLPPAVEEAAYYAVSESLANVLKY